MIENTTKRLYTRFSQKDALIIDNKLILNIKIIMFHKQIFIVLKKHLGKDLMVQILYRIKLKTHLTGIIMKPKRCALP
jgi:hypothetical protein